MHSFRPPKAVLFAGVILVVLAGTVTTSHSQPPGGAAQAAAAQPEQKAQSAGTVSSECADCHADIVKNFASTRHGKAEKFQAWGYTEGCNGCHGDTREHIATADPSKVFNPGKATAADVSRTCLTCHAGQHAQAFWSGSAHETSGVTCISCHSPHNAKSPEHMLVKRTEKDTCLSCHTDLRKMQFQRSTHLFRDENKNALISCTDCHNPHGSQTDKMLKGNSANETCYQCHTEKRGPFLWQHSPSQENCMTCHSPHGGNNPSLLVARTPQLCQSCHMQGRHQTVAGRSNAAFTFNRSCLNCHSQVHGSNHPSGVNLQR